MYKFEGKYFKLSNESIIHVKEIHYQILNDLFLIEIDDWAGLYTNTYILNNGNGMSVFAGSFFSKLLEVSKIDFHNKLIEEINKSIEEIEKGNFFCKTDFKKTDKRLEILRNRYGTKP